MLSSVAGAESRTLSLAEAVDVAMRVEPILAQAKIADERAKLGVLRAQLDRVTLRADASLGESWNKQNIGAGQSTCIIGSVVIPADGATCAALGGTLTDDATRGQVSVTTNLNVPLFSGFRISSNVKRAELGHESALAAIRQTRRETALAVARAYWAVRRVELLRDVQVASLERLREGEAVAEGRLRAGLAPPIDANRAKVRRIQQQATIADLEGQAREALAQLGVSLGIAEPLVLTEVPVVEAAPLGAVEGLIDAARGGRAEIERARLTEEAQRQVVRMVQSQWYPQLSLSAQFQVANNSLHFSEKSRSSGAMANPFDNVSGILTIGALASINIFDTLNTWTAAKDAKLEEARLGEERRRAGRLVEGEVRTAYARVERLAARRAPLAAAAEVARDNLKILEARYKNGDALVIELLESQNELAGIELQLADVTAQQQIARLELDAALGKTVGEK